MNFIEAYKKKVNIVFKKLLKSYNVSFSFLQNSLFQRWAIAITLCLVLALIMAPEFHFSEPQFKMGMIADRKSVV